MALLKFENTICTADTSFLSADKYTFSVLIRILAGQCALTLIESEKLVICHSTPPYPVWVWLSSNASKDQKERAYSLSKEHFDFKKHRFNLSHSLSEYFIERGKEDGIDFQVEMNMLAYSCESPIEPKRKADGFLEVASQKDLDEVTNFIKTFHVEIDMDIHNEEVYKQRAQEYINTKTFFFWNNNQKRVACCLYREMETQCSIACVFTANDQRRSGYASNLVYSVSKLIVEKGKTPTLYTDADYSASNSCYTQIGFELRGALCEIGCGNEE